MSEIHYAARERVSLEDRENLLSEQNGRCAYCGKLLNVNSSVVEHSFPRAVFKWLAPILDDNQVKELHDLTFCKDNLYVTHRGCNLSREERFEFDRSIFKIANDNKLKRTKLVWEKASKYLEAYKAIVEEVYARELGFCCVCNKPIYNIDTCSLRRKDNKKSRVISNARIVHPGCNILLRSIQK